jgi:hypothetical protein
VHRYDDPWDLHNLVFDVASISDWEIARLLDDGAKLFGHPPRFRARCDETGRNLDTCRRCCESAWLADGVDALQLQHLALGDYSYTSSGNLHRSSLLFDWVQARYADLDDGIAGGLHLPTVLGSPLVNGGLDHVQNAAGHVYRTAQRIGLHVLSRGVIEPVEDTVGFVRNAGKATPSEILVKPQ